MYKIKLGHTKSRFISSFHYKAYYPCTYQGISHVLNCMSYYKLRLSFSLVSGLSCGGANKAWYHAYVPYLSNKLKVFLSIW